MNKNIALQQQIKMLAHGTGKRVLHGDYGSGGRRDSSASNTWIEWHTPALSAAHKLQRRLMAKRSALALDCNLHPYLPLPPQVN